MEQLVIGQLIHHVYAKMRNCDVTVRMHLRLPLAHYIHCQWG